MIKNIKIGVNEPNTTYYTALVPDTAILGLIISLIHGKTGP